MTEDKKHYVSEFTRCIHGMGLDDQTSIVFAS